jgi:hypothetical protein
MARFRKITAVSIATALMLANLNTPAFARAEDGPGCRIEPASPSVGADIPQSYFAPPASTDNPLCILFPAATSNVREV